MLAENQQANNILREIAATAQNTAIKGGFAAETWHAESFNLDAILKDQDVRAFTDKFNNSPLAKNHSTNDIVVMRGQEQVRSAQLKYYKTADDTQKAFRATKDGVHQYQDSDVFLAPSDQLEGIKQSANRDVLKNQDTRPQVASAAEKVRDRSADHLDVDGVQSTPLSKQEAEQLGKGSQAGKDLHKKMQNDYLNKATIQESLHAARSAALITTVVAGSMNTFHYLQQMRDGQISAKEAARRILQDTVIAAGDSALKAGAASASVSTAARAMPGLFVGGTFKTTFAKGGMTAAAVCTVDLVQCIVLYACGNMTSQELETRTGKNLFQSGAGVAGASVGAAIGALGGPLGALVGGIIGGAITTLAMSIALDNHIEKPLRLTLANTEQIADSARIVRNSLEYLHTAQAFYAQFHKELFLADRHFAAQVKTLSKQSKRLEALMHRI